MYKYVVEELVYLFFYVKIEGNIGIIQRSLINTLFGRKRYGAQLKLPHHAQG